MYCSLSEVEDNQVSMCSGISICIERYMASFEFYTFPQGQVIIFLYNILTFHCYSLYLTSFT